MYPDPKRIRNNKVTVRLDDYESDLLIALSNYTGEQVSTLIRNIIMQQALKMLEADEVIIQKLAA